MRLRLLATAGLAVGLVAPAVAQERATACDGPQDACQQVANLVKSYDDAFNKGDAATVAAIFTPDGIEMTEAPKVSGREAIERHYSDAFKAGLSHVVVNVDELHVVGDTTWGVGDWSATGPGPNHATRPYHGNWGAVWVRNGGTWRLRMLTNNTIETPPQ